MSGTKYSFSPLDVPEALFTVGFAINNSGTIVGATVFSTAALPNGDDQSSGFVGTAGDLTAFSYPASDYTSAQGINDSGTVVGEYRDNSVSGNVFRGFVMNDGTFTSVNILPTATSTFPYAINNEGDTAGGYRTADGNIHGYVDIGGQVTTVDIAGSDLTYVHAINNNDDYAGFANREGFEVIDGVTTIIDVPGSTYTDVDGMNDSDELVGNYFVGSSRHGFVYQNGTYTTIDYPGVASGTYAWGINDLGQIVGSDGGSDGFLATPVACFARDSRIATPTGAVAVQALRVGDPVLLFHGGEARVTWLGRRLVDCRRHRRPQDVNPVRVRAHAFAPDQPHRDLFLSPDHSVFMDGILIPIRYLINGATVAQVAVASVTYFHIELADHAVLLAEGLPCESYLDTGNRAAFANSGAVTMLNPDFAVHIWETRACAKLAVAGAELIAAREHPA